MEEGNINNRTLLYYNLLLQFAMAVFKGRSKSLEFIGFLGGEYKFTPYLHLWKIESEFKTYGKYKRYVLKIRN